MVQNSWGTAWGASGFAVLPYDDWIVNATDAWACRELYLRFETLGMV